MSASKPVEFQIARLGSKLVILDSDGYEVVRWSKDEWDENIPEIINAVNLVDEYPEALVEKYYDKSWWEIRAERVEPEWQSPKISEDSPLEMSVKITDTPEFCFEFAELENLDVAIEQAKVQAVSAMIHEIEDVEFELDFSNRGSCNKQPRKADSTD